MPGRDETPAVSLIFNSNVPRVPGEMLEGEVHLYFPTLLSDNIEEVHIKLRGSIITEITRQQGQNSVTRRSRVDLARSTTSLWRKGSAYPPPSSHTLALPFRFQLPTSLPPSCSFKGHAWLGTVGYAVEAVGVRHGILNFNRRVLASFPVLPIEELGAILRSTIAAGQWQGGWKTMERMNNVRRGIWGDYSQVKAVLRIADIPVMPIQTPIPFTLTVVTITKPVKIDDVEGDEPIFPAPPTRPGNPAQLDFTLFRTVFVRVPNWTKTSNDSTGERLGGFGELHPRYPVPVEIKLTDKVWIPSEDSKDEKKSKGRWKQEVIIRSAFTLRQPPAFQTDTLRVQYSAKVKVGFPGIGNDIKFEFPLQVVSCMPPLGAQWDGPPPMLDLPPSYFAGTEWQVNDEKGDE